MGTSLNRPMNDLQSNTEATLPCHSNNIDNYINISKLLVHKHHNNNKMKSELYFLDVIRRVIFLRIVWCCVSLHEHCLSHLLPTSLTFQNVPLPFSDTTCRVCVCVCVWCITSSWPLHGKYHILSVGVKYEEDCVWVLHQWPKRASSLNDCCCVIGALFLFFSVRVRACVCVYRLYLKIDDMRAPQNEAETSWLFPGGQLWYQPYERTQVVTKPQVRLK